MWALHKFDCEYMCLFHIGKIQLFHFIKKKNSCEQKDKGFIENSVQIESEWTRNESTFEKKRYFHGILWMNKTFGGWKTENDFDIEIE